MRNNRIGNLTNYVLGRGGVEFLDCFYKYRLGSLLFTNVPGPLLVKVDNRIRARREGVDWRCHKYYSGMSISLLHDKASERFHLFPGYDFERREFLYERDLKLAIPDMFVGSSFDRAEKVLSKSRAPVF